MGAALQQGLGRIQDLQSPDSIFETLNAFVEDPFIDRLHQQYEEKIKASGGKDSTEILAGLEGQLTEAGRKIQNAKAERLAELLEGFTVETPSALDFEAVAKMREAANERNEEPLDPEIVAKTDHILTLLDEIHGETDGYSEKARMEKIKEALGKIPQNVTVESKNKF